MIDRARIWGFAVALAALTAVFAAPAVADSCTRLSSLVLPEVISITATSIAADSFTPPGLTTPVPVAFCRVQITVTQAINIEVWLPPAANWNHRFQAEGGGGYAGVISYSALVMAVTGVAGAGQFATASTDTGHPATGTANGQGGANGAQAGGGFALNTADDTLNEGLIVDFASRSLHEMTLRPRRSSGPTMASRRIIRIGTAARRADDRGGWKRRCSPRITTGSSPAHLPLIGTASFHRNSGVRSP